MLGMEIFKDVKEKMEGKKKTYSTPILAWSQKPIVYKLCHRIEDEYDTYSAAFFWHPGRPNKVFFGRKITILQIISTKAVLD